jgi:hypothetical protein
MGGEEVTGVFPCSGDPSSRGIAAGASLEQEVIPLYDLAVGTYEMFVIYGHVGLRDTHSQAEVTLGVVNPFPAH